MHAIGPADLYYFEMIGTAVFAITGVFVVAHRGHEAEAPDTFKEWASAVR